MESQKNYFKELEQLIRDHFLGNEFLFRQAAKVFCEDLPGMLDNLKMACKKGEADVIESVAHSLRGSVLPFGWKDEAENLLVIESLAAKGELATLSEKIENVVISLEKLRELLLSALKNEDLI